MRRLSKFFVAAFALQMTLAASAFASEEIGKAVSITVSVTGDNGPLSVSSPIHRDERIQTSTSGTGQFEFRDGTKLAIGPNSTLVIDRSVFVGSSSFKNLSLKATRGAFRWISGTSKSSAYQINTRLGTLGIRGTAVDFYVGSSAVAVVLLRGKATFCGLNGICKRLEHRCDIVVADRNGVKEAGKQRSKIVVNGVKNEETFPFLTGTRKLSQPFRVGGGSCGLSKIQIRRVNEDGSEEGTKAGGSGRGGGGNPNGPS